FDFPLMALLIFFPSLSPAEYPASRGGKPEDKRNFVALLRELKQAFSDKGYILSAAVSAGKYFADPAYDIPQISKYLDWIGVMCYDYHGGWESKTGHNAPLYARPDEYGSDRILNVVSAESKLGFPTREKV